MALKILITNDDGIYAEGIKLLVDEAKKYGSVMVVAPKVEQSGMSHALTLRKPMEIKKIKLFDGVDSYYVDSTPADCVRYAYYGLKYDFDILLSAVNKGYNVGDDIMYSGTAAAAFEASSMGKKAIAFSCCAESFDGFKAYIDKVISFVMDNKLLDEWNLYNINFPQNPKDIKITEVGGCNFITYYDFIDGMYYQTGDNITESNIEKLHLDTACVMNSYVSITPLTHVRTNETVYKKIKNINKN